MNGPFDYHAEAHPVIGRAIARAYRAWCYAAAVVLTVFTLTGGALAWLILDRRTLTMWWTWLWWYLGLSFGCTVLVAVCGLISTRRHGRDWP